MSCIALGSKSRGNQNFGSASNTLDPTFLDISENKLHEDGLRSQWEVDGHCSTLLFPSPYPDLKFITPSCKFYYFLHTTNCYPNLEFIGPVRQAYYQVLFRLKQKGLQVKNFILPVQLMKIKYIDPYSRQKFIEDISEYLSFQIQLRSIVMEEASISFFDLCRLLVAIAINSHVKRLYLWNVLNKCDIPFRGPLQSDINLDDMPRIPYTYNPGGRKYLRHLQQVKRSRDLSGEIELEYTNRSRTKRTTESIEISQTIWLENLLKECKKRKTTSTSSTMEQYNKLMMLLSEPVNRCGVYMQRSVGTQYDSSGDSLIDSTQNFTRTFSGEEIESEQTLLSNLHKRTKLQWCKEYLKNVEHDDKNIIILREIYLTALNAMANLTTLSVNYCLLADGTGQVLLSIGSVNNGKLLDLELLCLFEELPSTSHEQYNMNSLHAIPDVVWKQVKVDCPALKVHLVCVSMSVYDVTRRFITRSIPLNSLHIDNGFCPTLVSPQVMFYSTLKELYLNYKETFENISIVLWQTTGMIDSSLNKLLRELPHLRSFDYCGPLQHKTTISQLCETALAHCKELINFKLLVHGDACFPQISMDLTAELYKKFKFKFHDRSIKFMLGTHNS